MSAKKISGRIKNDLAKTDGCDDKNIWRNSQKSNIFVTIFHLALKTHTCIFHAPGCAKTSMHNIDRLTIVVKFMAILMEVTRWNSGHRQRNRYASEGEKYTASISLKSASSTLQSMKITHIKL